ncbi:MAG TPA: hydrogenase formation protein HypD [Phycisphaerae bacterium]|nr:hydrogenase formation protein HypD [Phycisphaerae bacterium]
MSHKDTKTQRKASGIQHNNGGRSNPGIAPLVDRIAEISRRTGPVQIMEVCGTHTVSLFRTGIKSLMPAGVRLVSGPGCPVCVTSQGYIDAACELAERPEVTICTYGDMVRVPGRTGSLERLRGRGAQVLVVYSARDAVKFAAAHPERQVIFLAVGFETTAPATAAAAIEADRLGLDNFGILTGHKLVIPALEALLSGGDVPIDGFLLPGHVSVVIGVRVYEPVARDHGKPCVVTGFEPQQMLVGIVRLMEQIDEKRPRVDNVYSVVVRPEGNPAALRAIGEVFEPTDTIWRAMGVIPRSGLELRDKYRRFDALSRFGLTIGPDYDPPGCQCGQVIQGKVEPADCPLFGIQCTPAEPVGPCMVSSEGTCAAWYKYGRTTART